MYININVTRSKTFATTKTGIIIEAARKNPPSSEPIDSAIQKYYVNDSSSMNTGFYLLGKLTKIGTMNHIIICNQ